MDWYVIVLRLIHILSGVFWVGAATAFFLFVQPSIVAAGPAGGPVMREISVVRRFPMIQTIAATLTVLAGFLLYVKDSAGFDTGWIFGAGGIGFTIGGLAAFGAWVAGLGAVRPRVARLGVIGAAVAASGGPPDAEQQSEIGRIQGELRSLGVAHVVLFVIAVAGMASARYLAF
jgi:uncharacterized membrane protein